MKKKGGIYSILLILMLCWGLKASAQNPAWMFWDPWNSLIPSRILTAIEVDNNGTKWIGTNFNGIYSFGGVNWTNYNTTNS